MDTRLPLHTDVVADIRAELERSVVAVCAPVGYGKTAVLDGCAEAEADDAVLRTAGDPSATDWPFGLFATLVELAGVHGPEAERAWAIVECLCSGGPALLIADDLQWADDASLSLLAGLAERGVPEGLRILAASRPLPPGRRPGVDRLMAAARVVRLPALAPGVLDDRAAGYVAARTVGAGSDTMAVAMAAAVLGEAATVARIARLAQLGTETTAREWEDLGGVPLAPEVARALLELAGATGSAELHRSAATVLDSEGAAAALVAAHLLHATPAEDERAVSVLTTHATAQRAHGLAAEAVTLLERALVEPPAPEQRFGVRLALAEARAATGAEGMEEDFAAAIDLADEPGDCTRALAALARARIDLGHFASGCEAADRAVAALPADADPQLARSTRATAMLARVFTEPLTAGDVLHAVARPPEPATAEERGLLAHVVLTAILAGTVDVETAHERLIWALDDGRLAQDPTIGVGGVSMVTGALFHVGDYASSVALTTEVLATGRLSPFEAGLVRYLRSAPLLGLGRLDEARADAEAAAAVIDPDSDWMIGPQWVLAWLAMERDEGEIGLTHVSGEHRTESLVGVVGLTRACVRAWVALSLGRYDACLESVERARRLDPPGTLNRGQAYSQWRTFGAYALIALGRTDEAVEMVTPEVRESEEWGAPHALVRPLTALGLATGGAEGEQLLERAAECAEASQDILLQVEALAHRGAAKRRAGRPAQAREDLHRARVIAVDHGLVRKVRWTEEELRAAGGRARSTPHVLTGSELRVAGRAAAGAQNKAIAAELFLSTKTVEFHLSNAYRKLGVRARRELGPALERLG